MTLNEFKLARICVIFAIVSCLIFCLIFVPIEASAAESDQAFFWTDVTQYGGILSHFYDGEDHVFSDSYGTGFYFAPRPGLNEVKLAMSTFSSVKYIDMIIDVGNGTHDDLIIKAFDCNLNVVKYGPYNNYWRLYGSIEPYKAQYDTFNITVQNNGTHNHYFSILQCRFSSATPYTDISGTWTIESTNISDSGSFPGSGTATDWFAPINSSNEPGTITLRIPFAQWSRYNFIDIGFILDVSGITSISASTGNLNGYIPLYNSYLGGQGYSDEYHLVQTTLDLRNVMLDSTSLSLTIEFNDWPGSSNYFNLISVHGWNQTPALSDVSYWGSIIAQILDDKLGSLGSGTLSPDQEDASQIVQDKNEILNNQVEQLATIPRPELSQIGSPNDVVEDIGLIPYTRHLTILTNSNPFKTILFISALFTLIGVVLHGRRQ